MERLKPPNVLLTQVRRRMRSPSGSGRPMSRQELADAVNAYLWDKHRIKKSLDETDIGRLERGENRWPGKLRREAFRAVLRVQDDSEIGFYIDRASTATSHASQEESVASAGDMRLPEALSGTIARLDGGADDGWNSFPVVTTMLAQQRQSMPAASNEAHSMRSTSLAHAREREDNQRDHSDRHQAEVLRRELDDALSVGMMAEASLDDWERTVIRYGRATRDRSPSALLGDLSADLVELKNAMLRHRSASALRRLTRAAAHMSGLMCLTFCRLDDRPAFRRWARTARLAAQEAGDPETHSWILAHEAYGHYYSGDILEAIDVAEHAQAVVAARPSVGAALAAALEARAYGAIARPEQTRAALGRAETILSRLNGDALLPSAFGYNEAQLRFHEGNAYTRLGDARAAFVAQDRALALCAPGDYTDWALTRLDRASCLTRTGESTDALNYAVETLSTLSDAQRQGIITLRGHEILDTLPKDQQSLPAARDFRELLLTSAASEVPSP